MSRASLTCIQFESSQAGFLVTYMPNLVGQGSIGAIFGSRVGREENVLSSEDLGRAG